MRLSGRQALILAPAAALLGVGLYLLLVQHPSQKRSIWRLKQQEVSLSSELVRAQRELEAQRRILAELVARNAAVQYLPGPGRAGGHTPRIVERIAQAANACQVDVLSLGPGTAKETGYFTEYGTPVKLAGDYGPMVQLVRYLEQTLGLRLFQLALRSGPAGKERQRQELSFILNTYEIKGDAPLALPERTWGKADLSPSNFSGAAWHGRQDPFQGVQKASPVEHLEPTRMDPVEPVYHLSGILSFGGKLKAIVNDRLVGEGDRIQDDRVIAITRDSVTFLHQGRPLTVQFKPVLLDGNRVAK